ncbi:MAG: fumarylacetoacetate hydrolase family protein [Steroidobacteraceae bacterium]
MNAGELTGRNSIEHLYLNGDTRKANSVDAVTILGAHCAVGCESAAGCAAPPGRIAAHRGRRTACCSQMIFDVPAIIASLSVGLTLDAADIIATGTPAGVGFGFNPPRFLNDGDVIVARIEGLGELVNPVERR